MNLDCSILQPTLIDARSSAISRPNQEEPAPVVSSGRQSSGANRHDIFPHADRALLDLALESGCRFEAIGEYGVGKSIQAIG